MGGEKNFFLKKTKKKYFRLADKGQRWGKKNIELDDTSFKDGGMTDG